MNKDPSMLYRDMLRNTEPELMYTPDKDYDLWRSQVKEKLLELLGMPEAEGTPEVVEEYTTCHDGVTEVRFAVETEPGLWIPAHLLIPEKAERPVPVMICIQGHSTGMHISLGRPKFPGDEQTISGGDRDFALQCLEHGYAALTMEQRGMGETKEQMTERHDCWQPAMQALLLGRTTIGDRVYDVGRMMEILGRFAPLGIDPETVYVMGNSGGGTTSFFAACVLDKLSGAMPSGYFSSFADSIGSMLHCTCNYIPGIRKYVEMADLTCLIAPKPLVLVSGREDPIFPYEAVVREYQRVAAIYEAAGAADRCRQVTGEEGHRFYAKEGWAAFEELVGCRK